MNNIENIKNFIDELYKYPDCEICNNSRIIENTNDPDYLDNYVNSPPLIQCECVKTINKIKNNAFNSRMNIEELSYNLKEYKKYLKTDTTSLTTEQFEATRILDKYIENFKKVIKNNTNMYLYSLSPMLSKIVGCSLLNEFILKGYTVRIYDGCEIINSIIKSFKNEEKFYVNNIIESEEYNRMSFYFDEFENQNDVIYIHNIGFKDIHGYTITRFKNTLQKRRRNNLITIVSSNEKYYDNTFKFELESFVDISIGSADIAKSQFEMFKGFIE
jgi:hypothetical protein